MINPNPSFMDSHQFISFFKLGGFSLAAITLALMLLNKQEINSKLSMSVGSLLAAYGLLMVSIWDVNYVVIGMGLVAISGIVLIFQTGIGKLLYILAVLWLSIFANMEFGETTIGFFKRVAFLYIIGVGIFFFVKDNTPELKYYYDRDVNNFSEKDLLDNARLTERAENANFDSKLDNIKKIWRILVVIGFILAMIFIVFRVKSVYS